KQKKFDVKIVFLIQFFTMAICVLFFYDLQTYKLNPLFIMLLVFGTETIVWIYEKKKILANFIIFTLILVFFIFEIFYYKEINNIVGIGYNKDFIPLIEYLEDE